MRMFPPETHISQISDALLCIVYVFGFFWGCVNTAVCVVCLRTTSKWLQKRTLDFDLKPLRLVWAGLKYLVPMLVLLAVAAVLSLGPFFSPFVGIKLAQKVVRFLQSHDQR